MNTPQMPAAQVPLIELLRSVPATARLTVDDGPFSTRYIPVGRYCHEAADALAARDAQVQAALAEQEPVAWRVGAAVYDDINMARWSLRDAEHGYPIEELIVRPALPPMQQEASQPEPSTPAAQERAEPVAPAVGEAFELAGNGITHLSRWEPAGAGLMSEDYLGGYLRRDHVLSVLVKARTALSATPPAPAQPTPWQTFRQVTVALSGLLEQVEKFVSKNGEADFETGEALRAVEAAIAFDDQMPAQPSPEPRKPEQDKKGGV